VSDAEQRADLLQEIFARAFSDTARRRFDATLDFRSYLLAITRNLLVDHYRRFKPRPLAHTCRLDEVCADTDGTDQLLWQSSELVAVVERYVAALNAPLREIYHARYVLGRSQRDTACGLGLSRQTVRTLEERVKAGLRSALRQAGHAERAVRNALEGRLPFDGSKAAS
jgi:RNA polymerase sigma factor (sigma-70 family)